MSYQVYDENGYVGDFATTKGMNDFMKWCESTEDDDLTVFADAAVYIVPEALLETLQMYEPPLGEIRKTYDNFLKLLPKCQGLVIISDGLNDDLDDLGDLEE